MTREAQAHLLADGRLHLHHGPIDVVAEAFGMRDGRPGPRSRRAAG
jgi:hypothetical protein